MGHARRNGSQVADINLGEIFASGTFKNVFLGTYVAGPRRGQLCVAKEFKAEYRGSRWETYYFEQELEIVHHTRKILESFNRDGILPSCKVIMNTPEIWRRDFGQQPFLIEPMIEGFEKFNSNSGWVPKRGTPMSDELQALSHFSYHKSNGRYLLCDVQGGGSEKYFFLTDPVIMSDSGTNGPGDLGRDGISEFFKKHRCTPFCRSHWLKPAGSGGGWNLGNSLMRKGTFFPRR